MGLDRIIFDVVYETDMSVEIVDLRYIAVCASVARLSLVPNSQQEMESLRDCLVART